MKAIETSYAGCRFRSRLEARWAVFFDTLGIKWEHEPQGYELTSLPLDHWARGMAGCETEDDTHLGRYLPDFWLPELATWFEVKGQQPDDDTWARLFRFSHLAESEGRVVIAVGSLPDPRTLTELGHPMDESFDIHVSGDFHYAWCICPWCDKPGIEFDARSARICGYKTHHSTEDEALDTIRGRNGTTTGSPWWQPDGQWWRDRCWRADDKCYTGDHPRIIHAYTMARSARFEHGEAG